MIGHARVVWLLVPVLLLSGGRQASAPNDTLTRTTIPVDRRVAALSLLWREASVSFAYADRLANWDSLYEAFIPRVREAKSDYEYYLELMRFYAHLEDGHSGVAWPSAFDDALGYPPFEIRKVDGKAVIVRVLHPSEELERERIRPGVAILRVDNQPVEERVEYWRALMTGSTRQATDRLAYFRILTGPRNSHVNVLVAEPDSAPRTVRLTRSERYFNDTNLDPPRLHVSRTLGGNVGYFQANQMHADVALAFGNYIEAAHDLTGLIIDLRYNGGGSDFEGFRMVSRLIDQPLAGPIDEVTSYRADRRAARQQQEQIRTPRGPIAPASARRFTGPLVVLIGEQTHSAAESGFLAVIRARPRTLLVGEPTGGSTGQPLVFPLPGGGLGVVCSRRSLLPDGRTFVGVGFVPDIRISLTQRDLFQGRDRVLERAVEVLRSL